MSVALKVHTLYHNYYHDKNQALVLSLQMHFYFVVYLLLKDIVFLNIIDARINGYAFLSLNESRLERFGVSFGFQFTLMNIIENEVCIHDCISDVCNVCGPHAHIV